MALDQRLKTGLSWFGIVAACVGSGVLITRLPATSSSFTTPGVYAIVAIAAGLFPIVRRILNGTLDIFEPIVAGCAMLVCLFGVRPLVMLGTSDFTLQQTINIRGRFAQATFAGTLATVCFVVAYETWTLTRANSVPRRSVAALDPEATWTAALILTAIGFAIFILRLALVGNPLTTLQILAHGRSIASADANVSSYLNDGPLLASCAATLVVIALRGKLRQRDRAIIAALVFAPVVAFYLLGNRRLILPSLLIPVIAYYFVRGRRPRWQSVAILVPVAFVILATLPFARSLGARQNTQGGALGIFEQSFEAPLKPVSQFFTGPDTAMVPALALEMDTLHRPSDYYFGRATLGDLLLSPIPSALVPGKPTSARNSFLITIFGQPCGAAAGRSPCPDFSTVGTFYQDLWFFGVVGGMLMLGVLSAWLWRRFRESPESAAAIVFAASWAVSLPILIRAGFMPAFQWWLEFVVPSYLAIRIIQSVTVRPSAGGYRAGETTRGQGLTSARPPVRDVW